MQVRSIEFQENFRSVTVEASRQQNVVQREADAAQHRAAAAGVEDQALNLSRPRPATETEGRIVDPDAGGESTDRGRSRRQGRPASDESNQESGNSPGLPKGSVVDITA